LVLDGGEAPSSSCRDLAGEASSWASARGCEAAEAAGLALVALVLNSGEAALLLVPCMLEIHATAKSRMGSKCSRKLGVSKLEKILRKSKYHMEDSRSRKTR
jgi:hypothetical protein